MLRFLWFVHRHSPGEVCSGVSSSSGSWERTAKDSGSRCLPGGSCWHHSAEVTSVSALFQTRRETFRDEASLVVFLGMQKRRKPTTKSFPECTVVWAP